MSKGKAIAESMFVVSVVGTGNEQDMSYAISHLWPTNRTTFIGRTSIPASLFVMNKLIEVHSSIMYGKFCEIIRTKQNAGSLFEFMASRFVLANNTHTASRLGLIGETASTFTPRNLDIGKFETLPPQWMSKQQGWIPIPDVLYYQNKVNLQSIDAFTIIGRELVFFQLTIGARHSIQASGLLDILTLFAEGLGLVDSCSLMFVVPIDSKLGHVQPLLRSDSKVYSKTSSIPKSIRHLAMEQFVIKVDLNRTSFQSQS